jgi:subtilisin family serine protease
MSCGSPTPPSSPIKTVLITHSVIKKIAENKASRSPQEKIMQSELLEIIEQYQKNGNTFEIPDSILSKEDLLQPSSAKIDDKDSILCYFYATPGITFSSFQTVISKLRLAGVSITFQDSVHAWDSTYARSFVQGKIHPLKVLTAAGITDVKHIALITDPIQGSLNDAEDILRTPRPSIFPDFPDNRGTSVMVGVLSDDCGSTDIDPSPGNTSHQSFLDYAKAAPNKWLGSEDGPLPGAYDNATSRSHEGLAMMEAIHQIAPGATIKFATATGPAGGARETYIANIESLAVAGCKVIVDDIIYPEEAAFGDGDVAKKMEQLSADRGTIFISAAGNLAKRVYSFRFKPSLAPVPYGIGSSWQTATIHENISQDYNQDFDIIPGYGVDISLQWDDTYDASENDFDMYLVDKATGYIVAFSNTPQLGAGDHPYEHLGFQWSQCWGKKGYRLYITAASKLSTTPVQTSQLPKENKHHKPVAKIITIPAKTYNMKLVMRGRITGIGNARDNSMFGHPTNASVIACGAVDVASPLGIEDFSSRGISADALFVKPDICALDNISTHVPGYDPFGGTSAAAPVAAGIAAVMLSNSPVSASSPTNAEMQTFKDALRKACINYSERAGMSHIRGYGRADAFQGISSWLFNLHPDRFFANFHNLLPASGEPRVQSDMINIPNSIPSGVSKMYVSVSLDHFYGTGILLLGLTKSGNTYGLCSLAINNGVVNPNVVFYNGASAAMGTGSSPNGCYIPVGLLPVTSSDFVGDWVLSAYFPTSSGRIRKWGIFLK